jgi:hypothetical protein
MLLAVLTACAPPAQKSALHWSLVHQAHDFFYAEDGLTKTIDAFVGPENDGSNPVGEVPRDVLSDDSTSGVAFKKSFSRLQGVKLRLQHPLTNRLSLTSGAMVGVGRAKFILPDGAGILVEPITIRFTTLSGEVQTGLLYEIPTGQRVTSRFTGAVGVRGAVTRTGITSPVLAVKQTSKTATPFAALGLAVTYRPSTRQNGNKLVLDTEVRSYKGVGLTFRSGVSLEF